MDFDELIDRRGTHSAKWDLMEPIYGVDPDDGIAMWVADMDFRPPQAVRDALTDYVEQGVYGYFGGEDAYRASIRWWMRERHGWEPSDGAIFTTHGLVNGTAVCVEAFTDPGDAVVLMTPVYHAFHRILHAAGREIRELPLANEGGRYEMDFDAWEARMTGNERMLILCSPHNPGGRVWTRAELEQVAAFARDHDLIIVSDEIHCDLVFPGQSHTAMTRIEGIEDRLVMLTAATKTFNIAGAHIGNVIVENPDLRARVAGRMSALGLSPNSFGMVMVPAAYSPDGAAWVDALMPYLEENRRIFDEAIAAIPGLASMPLEATYLAWVDGRGAGFEEAEFARRVEAKARIAVNHGSTFGMGGTGFMRFNIATPRARVEEAARRMKRAFRDLQ
ncbi:pyridoxal phosphate-dependent aminotransferase [Mesobaculum littorinae]|uniref:cysteine-S-conjugate beta-lyase n=1 Tax=Mesobaculum littorinae TaxID=2486419 RepID=A0A438ADM6_9RHOB|nr:MalY/PatB family protein [Mesobaculum littorinae]RVV96794.1 pyridoxal phosphate-dependent aminotransferase [Mesobaculum littorinae]